MFYHTLTNSIRKTTSLMWQLYMFSKSHKNVAPLKFEQVNADLQNEHCWRSWHSLLSSQKSVKNHHDNTFVLSDWKPHYQQNKDQVLISSSDSTWILRSVRPSWGQARAVWEESETRETPVTRDPGPWGCYMLRAKATSLAWERGKLGSGKY